MKLSNKKYEISMRYVVDCILHQPVQQCSILQHIHIIISKRIKVFTVSVSGVVGSPRASFVEEATPSRLAAATTMRVPRRLPCHLVFLCPIPIHAAWAVRNLHQHCEIYGISPCKHRGSTRGSAVPSSFGVLSTTLSLSASNDDDDDQEVPKKIQVTPTKKTKSKKKSTTSSSAATIFSEAEKQDEKARKKQELINQLRNRLAAEKKNNQAANLVPGRNKSKNGGLLDKLNPFQAGQSFRQTLGSLSSLGSGGGLNQETRQKYYLDDRFLESRSSGILSERNPFLERQEDSNTFVPEVLVIGATGEIGRLVVRRLRLEGRFRVRVLVRDLYSRTLNALGTGVTYCQGDLGNMESLEYALTDVDKIVFCDSGVAHEDVRTFEDDFGKEQIDSKDLLLPEKDDKRTQWGKQSSLLELRAQLAEQVDSIGMQNLVRAYQNVRHADYGTSQAAKRSVFKFSSRPGDFNLFSLDEGTVNFLANKMVDDEIDNDSEAVQVLLTADTTGSDDDENDDDPYAEYDDYSEFDEDDDFEDNGYYEDVEARRDATVKSQIKWNRNEFGHGVFVGKVPKTDSSGLGGVAAIVSSRLRSREDPESGIDLSGGFAGFIIRLVGDGSNYEAFVRTEAYESTGIEYICQFPTATKLTTRESKSRNKFITVRLSFDNFRPVMQKELAADNPVVPPFNGSDVRYIGFRYRSASNPKQSKLQAGGNIGFYIALSYVKVYRQQPEPEFVYLSDARIPPIVRSGIVRHDQRRLLVEESSSDRGGNDIDIVRILDDKALLDMNALERSQEETYFKFRGEEILKNSGLSYTIIRVAGYNDSPSGEASTIDLSSTNNNILPVSRAEAAQVCVSALLDPAALNKSVYMGKQKGNSRDEDISAKFASLPKDSTTTD